MLAQHGFIIFYLAFFVAALLLKVTGFKQAAETVRTIGGGIVVLSLLIAGYRLYAEGIPFGDSLNAAGEFVIGTGGALSVLGVVALISPAGILAILTLAYFMNKNAARRNAQARVDADRATWAKLSDKKAS